MWVMTTGRCFDIAISVLEGQLRLPSHAIPLCVWFVGLFLCTGAQAQVFPVIGAKVPAFVTNTASGTRQCENGTARHDSCATVNLRGHRVTVGWDQHTKVVTYVFTDDRRLVGDSELASAATADSRRPRQSDSQLSRYSHWLVAKDWKESFHAWSGNATWYAALQVDSGNPNYATIVGFVQSPDIKPSH
jgi:hypothetical protein